MTFKNSERVKYKYNPLNEVICQVRFLPILKIESESPHEFQEAVRSQYPGYLKQVATALPPEIANLFGANAPTSVNHEFKDEAGNWVINLSTNSIALSSKNGQYDCWEDFIDRFKKCLTSFEAIYKPAYYTRVGLRYINVINKSKLKLDQFSWADLLNEHVVGELGSPDLLEQKFEIYLTQVVYVLEESIGKVKLQHGLAPESLASGDGKSYAIDSDFFCEEKIQKEEIYGKLQHFNRDAGNLFRWCISKKLHDAMAPVAVGKLCPNN